MIPAAEQLALIRRGCDQIVPEAELVKKLERSVAAGKPLRVKYGIDPTGIDVHLGHTVPLRKLRLFQELGHQAVLIIGNYTALVGDPSGRDQTRARLTQEQVEANAQRLPRSRSARSSTSTRPRSRTTATGSSKFQLPRRARADQQDHHAADAGARRLHQAPSKAGTPIYLHECLYPLMQGRDSVEIQADVELGGSEQLFSLMVGRDLQARRRPGAADLPDAADPARPRRRAPHGQEPGQLHRRRRSRPTSSSTRP